MRDMLSNDDGDGEDDHDGYHGESHQSSSHSTQRTPQLSSADFPPALSSSSTKAKVVDDSALPAHASWAKLGSSGTNSTPSTPVMAVSDAFGPTLSAAVAASQQKTQFPPMPKRKSEKKKRKEQLQQQKATPEPAQPSPTPSKAESSKSEQTPSSPSTSTTTEAAVPAISVAQPQEPPQPEVTAPPPPPPSLFEQGLTGFVLGQAYKDLCPLPSEEEFNKKQAGKDQLEDELTLGVSALLLDDTEKPPPQPSPAQRHLEAIQSAAASSILVNVPNVLDFLTYSTPTPKYNGRFNPFAHMGSANANTAAVPAAAAAAAPNRVNSGLDSPIRRHSRFGFAQA